MKRTLQSFLLATTLAAPAVAQAQDVGLTLDVSPFFGQDCGPVTCQPLPGGIVSMLQPRVLTHYGAAQSFYAIAIGLPGPCLQVPGFDNVLLLSDPIILIGAGITSSPPFVPLPCDQGIANETLLLPAGLAIGLVFRIQSIGISGSGVLAFSAAIEATIG